MPITGESRYYIDEMLSILGPEVERIADGPDEINGILHTTLLLEAGGRHEVFQYIFSNPFLTPDYLVTILESILGLLDANHEFTGTIAFAFPSDSRHQISRILTVNARTILELTMDIDVEVWFIDYRNAMIESMVLEELLGETGRDILESMQNHPR